MRRALFVTIGFLALTALSLGAQAPAPLPTGNPQQGTTTSDKPAEYTLAAKTPGVLTIAVQGANDLSIQVLDADGQVLPEGSVDRDLNGNEGTELAAITIGEAGTYRVRVRVSGGTSTFQIISSFLSFAPLARPADPDRRPGNAKAVQISRAYEDTLDSAAGDNWDWFVFKVSEAGTMTVLTRQSGSGDAPDLILEVFTDNDFTTPDERSDKDLQGNTANESVTLQVTAGQTVHVRVSHQSGRTASYRLSSSLAP